MKKTVLILIFLTLNLYASNEADNWFFGDYCGIRFIGKDKQPVFQGGSQMSTVEGCATISDISGNLLFYTNGQSIWNNQHVQMPNGNDLHGNESATQSAVVVQKPGSDNLFYIFTVDRQAAVYGLEYSIVDITKDFGRGDVIKKNVTLYNPITEKLTAVKHSNGKDIWVLAHEWESNLFLAYLLTDTGLVNVPIKSNVGTVHEGDLMNTVGYMKASPDGKFIGLCIYYDPGIVEILRFNNSTGGLSSPLTFSSPDYKTCYGVEFSPDGSKFYFTTSMEISRIYQIDMMAGKESDILNSVTIVAEYPYPWYYQALQFAPDNKIYVAKRDKSYLSAIEFPNLKGSACNFIENAFDLQGRKCKQGLPSFNQSYQDIYLNILGSRQLCEGETLLLKAVVSDSVSYLWSGPDGFSSTDSVIKIENVKSNNSGVYKITITIGNLVKTDSVDIIVNPRPVAETLPKDSAFYCAGSSIRLTAINDSAKNKIIWSTGDSSQTISVNAPGLYYLIVTNSSDCFDTAFVNVLEKPKPQLRLLINGPSKICKYDKTEIYPDRQFISYLWSTGETTERITVDQPGEYHLLGIDEFGCEAADTVNIQGYDLSVIAPADYDFGEVLVGTSKSKKFEFVNNGLDSIYISSIRKVFNTPDFIVSISPSLPVWLKQNEKLTIEVEFKPQTMNIFLDSIEIITAFPCNLFNSFQISGLSGSDLTRISIPDTSARIGSSKFKIPVYSQLFSKNEFVMSYKMGISFDASIFLPDYNQTVIKRNYISSGRRFIEIESGTVIVNKSKSIIFELDGTVLFSTGKHELKIEYFEWENPNVEIDTVNGSLIAFGICKPDLSTITLMNQSTMTASPNPANGDITISILPDIKENYISNIKLINIYGIIVFEQSYDQNSSIETLYLGGFPDGLLIVEVRTNGNKLSKSIMKMR